MHFTLHLTDACNMACRYCYVRQGSHAMTPGIARRAVDLAARDARSAGIVFFGGEPLLERGLIEETVAYGESLQAAGTIRFHYKITTNGILLDEAFLRYSGEHRVFVALSHDGVREAHDANRVLRGGGGTFDALEETAKRLLRHRPYAPVMMTVSPGVVRHYAAGVEYLYGLGFRYLICSMDYAGDWDGASLAELERQYRKLAAFYRRKTLAEEKFYLSPFELKIGSHIAGADYCADRCELGRKQISVAPDGRLYPCVQFLDDEAYCIGDVW
nr:radical SAM protein [Clostridia bacterium]